MPTIISRTIIWKLNPPTKEQIMDYYRKDWPESKLQKVSMLSRGRIGLLVSMLNEDDDHTLLQAIETAKDILAESSFERLCRVDTLIKDLPWMNSILEGLELACFAALENSAQNNNMTSIKSWKHRVSLIESCRNDIEQGLLPKLVLGKLFLVL